jgi:hypothetical protein
MYRAFAVGDQVFEHEAEQQAALGMGDDDGIGPGHVRLEHEFQVFLQQPLSVPAALRSADEIALACRAAVLSCASLARTFHQVPENPIPPVEYANRFPPEPGLQLLAGKFQPVILATDSVDEQPMLFRPGWFAPERYSNKSVQGKTKLIDMHGGKNSAVSRVSNDQTAYAYRDKLYIIQFYTRIPSGV